MTDSTSKTKRPSSITAVSAFEIIGGFNSFYFILAPGIQNYVRDHGTWDAIFVAFGGILLSVSGVGFWLMKRWAVYTFIVFALLLQVYLIAVGRWNVFSLLIPAIPIFIGYKHFSKMA